MKNALLTICLSLGILYSNAQNEVDALRFTTQDYLGSSRFVAMGSSFGALGGDISVLSTNPAGLGLYRNGEFTITPMVVSSNSETEYYGNKTGASDFNFAIGNLGYAQTYEIEKGKWKKAQFGFSYNRLKDLHHDFRAEGIHSESSLLDYISSEASAAGVEPEDLEDLDPFYINPAYFTYLINPAYDSLGVFYTDTLSSGLDLLQSADVQTRGRMSETIFGFSANYDDRLYLGLAMAFQGIVRDELTRYTETVVDTSLSTLTQFELYEDLETSGSGVNFKFGAIYRVNDVLRIGGSYTTPTWYTLSNYWITDISSEFQDGSSYFAESVYAGENDYSLRTPSKLLGSLALVIAKQGLINVDYEYVDYSAAKLKRTAGSNIDFGSENNEIRFQYVPVGNIRMGGEYRYGAFTVRCGYGFMPSPYEKGFAIKGQERHMYSGGLGYRKDRLNIDLAYRLTKFSSDYYPYSPEWVGPAAIDQENHSIMATLGLRF